MQVAAIIIKHGYDHKKHDYFGIATIFCSRSGRCVLGSMLSTWLCSTFKVRWHGSIGGNELGHDCAIIYCAETLL